MAKPILHIKFSENQKLRGQYFLEGRKFFIGTNLDVDHFCLLGNLRRYLLFKKKGQSYIVNIPEYVTGEIVKEGSKVEIHSLKKLGFIRQKNGTLELPIDKGQFGSLHWDDVTIDFDYQKPKSAFRAELAAISKQKHEENKKRQTTLSKVEHIFAMILILSIIIHVSFGLYAFLIKLPPLKKKSIEQVTKRFARLILEPPKKILSPVKSIPKATTGTTTTKKEGSGKGKKDGKSKKKTTGKKAGAKGGGDGKKAGGKKTGSRDVTSMGVLGVITSNGGSDDNTAIRNLQAFGIAKKLESAFGQSDRGGGGGDGTGWGESEGFPFLTSYGDGEYGDIVGDSGIEETVSSVSLKRAGDISFDDPSAIEGEGVGSAFRSPEAIRKAIMSQMEGVRYCFNQSLKKDSNISGKIVLVFTILAKGRVDKPRITSSTLGRPELENCVLEAVKQWRFQMISGGDVDVNYPLVFTPQG